MNRNLLAALITIGILVLGFCLSILMITFIEYTIYTVCFIFVALLIFSLFDLIRTTLRSNHHE
jgi:O-antigen/teichoic acid export membrane protein